MRRSDSQTKHDFRKKESFSKNVNLSDKGEMKECLYAQQCKLFWSIDWIDEAIAI